MRAAISARLWSAAMIPPTRITNPAAERTAPTTSNGRVGSGGTGSTRRRARIKMTTMMSAWKMKAARHVMVVVITPPIRGPMAAPIPPMALITPKAQARAFRSVNNMVVRM